MATLGEFISEGSATTKLLLHLNGDATDSSGNGNNGTSSNLTYSLANGKFGQGAGFNGSSSHIQLPTNAWTLFAGSNPWTVVGWIKGTGFTGQRNILHCTTSSSGNGYQKTLQVSINASRQIFLARANGTDDTFNTSTGTIPDNVWCQIGITYSNNTITFYINGANAGSGANSIVATTPAYGNLGVWVEGSTNYYWWSGAMDEFLFSNYAWSTAKIAKYFSYAMGRWATL